jgi:outer membrane receptor for ferrienterochelin and colicins
MIMNRFLLFLCLFIIGYTAFAQTVIKGKVVSDEGEPLQSVMVRIKSQNKYSISDRNGEFELSVKHPGKYDIIVNSVSWSLPEQFSLEIGSENTKEFSLTLIPKVHMFDDLVVFGASKMPEKITESPASILVQYPSDIEIASRKGQIAKSMQGMTGVDILQNGASDFIVNTRGFNNGLNRRILVLQDGRDAAMPLLGAQEWNSFALPLDEFAKVELVRGPSASLYGANAFNGVLNLTSYAPREVVGTKISLLAGDYETYRGDIRHAGILGDFSYKLTFGHQQMLNFSKRRDSVQFLEYPGIALERRVLTDDDRQTFSTYGTARLDYNFDVDKRIVSEFGYSRSGNETYVFGLGRTHVTDVARPYLRLGYNSERLNIHAHWMQRSVQDTMWLMVPNAPLLDDSQDFMIDVQHNFFLTEKLHVVWGLSQQLQQIRTSGTSIPDDVDADFTGLYGQLEWKINPFFKIVTSARMDYASIHSTQFSPRAALVFAPESDHQFRFSVGRSFQRPNYSELYRLTPDAPAFTPGGGPPVNFAAVQQAINDSIMALSGTNPELDLGLNAFRAVAFGNKDLDVEKNVGFEFGYKGIFDNKLFITADFYYNRLTDFITNFLPGVNTDIEKWSPQLQGDLAQYDDLVYDMVMNSLSVRDRERLSYFNGQPTFVVSNFNVGKVDQYGLEFGANYYINDEFKIGANYSYYNYDVITNNSSQPLLPNTSPHKINLSISYIQPKKYDAEISFNYTEGFEWLAGTYFGNVPSYAVMNFTAGYFITDNLHIGVNINNVLGREYYQVFGGTYLPRYSTVKLSYEF